MKTFPTLPALLALVMATALIHAEELAPTVIPAPAKLTVAPGHFQLRADTVILSDAESQPTAEALATRLRAATGYPLKVVVRTDSVAPESGILFALDPTLTNVGPEGYQLTATPQTTVIQAPTPAGLFYGSQTLLELLPPAILSAHPTPGTEWSMPCVQIEDSPRFALRGYMLDVSRHFFTVPEIKTVLDAMALRKMNLFHWHLVDDHGWRIEIKKYPKLTELGARRQGIGFNLDPKWSTAYGPDGRYGGFYTQAQIRDVVAYAAARHITILPEIEMPGHSLAALAAYPELGCEGKTFEVPSQLGIFDGIYCAGEEKTYTFLQDVLTEVFQLFPGKYIHLGGDEVPTNNWAACPRDAELIKREGLKDAGEIEHYFMGRMAKFVTAHGRTVVGWSEFRKGGLPPDSVLMDWNGGGAEAAAAGHDVIMAFQKSLYLCYYPSLDRTPALRAYRVCLPIEQVYAFDPVPATLDDAGRRHIIGTEACVWTPDIAGLPDTEKMTFPRLSAVAEIAWTPQAMRQWDDFSRRLTGESRRLDAEGLQYWHDNDREIGRWKSADVKGGDTVLQWDATAAVKGPGKYRVSLSYLKGHRGLTLHWVALLADGKEIVRDTHPGFTGNSSRKDPVATGWNYYLTLPAGTTATHYTVQAGVTGTGENDCSGVVFAAPE